jgi:hypothetical protein
MPAGEDKIPFATAGTSSVIIDKEGTQLDHPGSGGSYPITEMKGELISRAD